MIDTKSLAYTAHQLLKEVEQIGNLNNWSIKKIDVQHVGEGEFDQKTYPLMVYVKPNSPTPILGLPVSQELNIENLLEAAQELITAQPKPAGYEFFKIDVQEFSDKSGCKYILGVALREKNATEPSLEL